tara:strand:- start:2677 stop:4173 length:1497 start_codon:yes stop_codon:yes gene_type:complete
MGIKRYTAYKDNTITNAYKANLETRATGSNMGLADSMEIFSIYAQANSSSLEAARVLVQFPVSSSDPGTTILSDRTAGKIPASGSVGFYLKLANVVSTTTVPRDFTLVVSPVSQSWEEGYGVDLSNYSDETYGGTGSNWINAEAHTTWKDIIGTSIEGGSYLTASQYSAVNYKQTFRIGIEDLEVDITKLVEKWITGSAGSGYENYGLGVFLTCSQELCQSGDGSRSYYSKFFSARGSEYFFSRPTIEARWDNTRKDDRGKFFVSSSVLSGADNLMTLYLYNYYNGQPTNIDGIGTGPVYVRNYISASTGLEISAAPDNPITGGWVETGLYTASFALSTTEEVVFDRWSNAGGTICYYTGSYQPKTFKPSQIFYIPKYVTSIVNLKSEYCRDDNNRFRVFTREKNWDDTIYTRAAAPIQLKVVTDSYYKIFRVVDSKTVIDFGTGSYDSTRLSYDQSGSYFDLDTSLLESGYEYGIKFAYFLNQVYEEQSETFTFRVE